MITQSKETQSALTPQSTLTMLKEGNQRFVQNKKEDRNLLTQVEATSTGQYPYAAVLSCIDSRVPVELVFDQGIGDIFSARLAGNVVNEDVLGSIEYACKVAGSKVVLVLGHTKCGAVTSACKGVELGNITALLSKIQPAVKQVEKKGDAYTTEEIEEVVRINVHVGIDQIRKESPILKEMEDNGEISIIGGIYSVATGEVEFLESQS